ncbi:MAG: nucleotidyltransferase family protein, partial [Parafilimonas sp.]|nr:nucleotidyltransferase family protein [Parafilimonas sp.]
IKQNNGWGSNIEISDETDAVLETGGGLKRASWFFENETDFVLMNTDVLTTLPLDEMISFHKNKKALATLATTNRNTSRYFLFNEENILCGWKNVKTGEEKVMRQDENLNPKAFSGIHVINSEIFSLMQQQQPKFSMVDVYLSLCTENKILSFDHSTSKFIDVGKPESLQQAASLFQ